MKPAKLRVLKESVTRDLLHELVEDLIDAATDLGVGQANPMVDTATLEHALNRAAEKVYNALDALTYDSSS